MEHTRLTPLKQDLEEARRRLRQQDGKILVLSSQLEKKRVLAEEFETVVEKLNRETKEKDERIQALDSDLRRSQERKRFPLPQAPVEGDENVGTIEALLMHWQRSSSFRYVISGKDMTEDFLVGTPMAKVLLNSIQKAPRPEHMLDRSSSSFCDPQPCRLTEKKPTERLIEKPKLLACSSRVPASESCPFPTAFQQKLFASSTSPIFASVRPAPASIHAPASSHILSIPVLPAVRATVPQTAPFAPAAGIAMDRTMGDDDLGEGEDEDSLEYGSLDDTLVSELDLSCYSLDASVDTTPERPRGRAAAPHARHLSAVPQAPSAPTHAPSSMLSPNGFQKRMASIRSENERLQSNISRLKNSITGLHTSVTSKVLGLQEPRQPFHDVTNRTLC